MAQEEKEQHGTVDNSGAQGSDGNAGSGTDIGRVLGQVINTPASELPREAITNAVTIFSLTVGVSAVSFIWLSFLYPDKISGAIGILTPIVTGLYTLYCVRKQKAAKSG